MPTTSGDSFASSAVLQHPSHSARPRSELLDPEEAELQVLERGTKQIDTQDLSLSLQDIHQGRHLYEESTESSQQTSLFNSPDNDFESDQDLDQMGRKSKGIRTTGSETPTSVSSSGRNGDANGSMDAYRRKPPPLDDPSSQTAHLMSREGFSLNDVPPTPITPSSNTSFFDLPRQDRRNFLLLVLLYFLQGVPMGLATGSVPFLLKPKFSYSQIAVFSLASYPYSLKLLWSPIVDAVWSSRLGRRKSWILPIQCCSGIGMLYLSAHIDEMMEAASANGGQGVWMFTYWWFFLVFLCATQDIAVDGWALTLISPSNLSYASTAQTVGLTAGQFLSFTVFLAFNAPDFADRFLRSHPTGEKVMTLSGYLGFWGWAYLAVTLGLAILKREEKTKEKDGILDVYKSMWGVLKLKHIQSIIIIHLIAKIGFQANEAVTNLKLIDKGFSQEDLALTVLIDFPFEISLGYYAGRWSTAYPPIHVWCWAFIGRLVAAVVAQAVVMLFPANGVQPWYLVSVICSHIFSTFMSTVMFVAIAAFHAKIADPGIGGTYMTLLATVSNLGGTFPRYFVYKFIDYFTIATCSPPSSSSSLSSQDKSSNTTITSPFPCVANIDRDRCKAGNGTCVIQRDGYYITNIICVVIGAVTFFTYIRPRAMRLQKLPVRAWRLYYGEGGGGRADGR